ncbi:hydrolase [Brevundimonas aveniformis]|uniref:hydrolase n=1 Tax=Brevundimonas aveniformis TaxID=370977 RepID=UPI00042766D1|nr:hydrolase [Brevundimonas aveniformis]
MQILDDDRVALAHVEARGDAIIDRAVAWCAINSGSRNLDGLNTQLDVLEAEVRHSLSCDIERVPLVETIEVGDNGVLTEQPYPPALRLTMRPQAPTQVVLTGHYDTVYPASSPFQTVRVRDDGALHGPGIADMKGGISVILAALEAFEDHPARHAVGWTVLLSPDEEIGSLGSGPVLAELGRRGHLGLTYEPAMPDGALAGARKGSANWRIVVHGRSAHAGRAFHEGRNAIAGAAIIAAALHALNGRHEGVTLNVARITGGAPLNVVPDVAVIHFNARVPDQAAAAWVSEQVAQLAAHPPFEGLTTDLHGGFTRPPKPADASQQALMAVVAKAGALLGQDIVFKPSGGVCEGNNLHAAGLPNIDTLGVRGGDIHSEAEFAWPESFVERAQLSTLILAKVASGEIDAHALKRLRLETL